MNKELFESKWQQIRSQTTAWWSLISDLDLTKIDKAGVKLDKYVMMLRVKYGYTSEQAKEKILKNLAVSAVKLKAEEPKINSFAQSTLKENLRSTGSKRL